MNIVVSFVLLELLAVATISLSFCGGATCLERCIESEREALLKFKRDLKDPSNRLVSWNGAGDGADCCKWSGVVCDNFTGHVLELRLGNPFNHPTSYRTSRAENEAYQRSKFGGKINPSLLHFQHLNYLDLSGNSFEAEIPRFLGFMGKLMYLNLSGAGFMGIIPHQLGNLTYLRYLDLNNMIDSYYNNRFELYVDNLSWLPGLSLLQHLDLGYVNLGKAFDWSLAINSLPSLQVLRLSYCQLDHFHPPPIVNISSLSVLDLSSNQFDQNSLVLSWVFGLSNLVYLDLGFNGLQGSIPVGLQNLTSLRHLDLSYNDFNSSIPNWLGSFSNLVGLSNLVYLDLSFNDLQGSIPVGLQNLTSLRHLDLSYNDFNSSIPNWLGSFSNLVYISLGSNNLQGSISSFLANLSASIEVLYLDPDRQQLEGQIPRSFGRLCNLREISLWEVKMSQDISEIFDIFSSCISDRLESWDMTGCNIFGHLTSQIGQFKSLDSLYLSDNSISGLIPSSLGGLSSLERVRLSNNTLKGYLSETHFANLSKLMSFDVSGNALTLKVGPDWIPPFQLVELKLRSCHLGPTFPSWLLSQNVLEDLDISSSGIQDTVPARFWEASSQLYFLNFSNNRISGEIPNLSKATDLRTLDLSSNNLSGPPLFISTNKLEGIDLSNNAFSGSISPLLCNGMKESNELQTLNLEDNYFSGEIPDCWMHFKSLRVLNLGNNTFTGNLPPSLGSLSSLQSLHLQKNSLSGRIPESLRNCTQLESLNMGGNQFSGDIPTWIGEKFSRMVILNLRSNIFDGQFPTELCFLTSLQILDLGYNNLSGAIPKCLSNFSAMVTVNYSLGNNIGYPTNFSVSIEETSLVMKGKELEYSTILNLVRSIDLSKNNFSGEIPAEVTDLVALRSLNLSYNHFSGRIPDSIGAMKSLEAIDFSNNQLSDEIPLSISNLTSLNHLNLSYNNLSGEIPTSTQLQSFDASCFIGNDLCGSPLSRNCTETVPMPQDEDGEDDEDKVEWFYVSMALGCVVGFWFVIGPLIVNRRWRYMYSVFLDRLGDKCSTAIRKFK
ncbi:hypothetical protein WN944_002061 [Citrus x changshan-huyou]|uniref:Leucine-rich repeat-containing N-terminal plant-type domain-containing protein n=1 Tax=Citrus x changshan-huyou TaxID=2935761 RepID=A0AAP0MHM4_9ROSI